MVFANNPLSFQKIDHVAGTSTAYYISSGGAFNLDVEKNAIHLDAGGAIYFVASDSGNALNQNLYKVNAFGDATATLGLLRDGLANFEAFGIAMGATKLAVGVSTSSRGNLNMGVISVNTANLDRTGHITTNNGFNTFDAHDLV